MILRATNTRTKIVSMTADEREFAIGFLSFEDSSMKFYRSGGRTRTRNKAQMRSSLFDPFLDEFPTGVLAAFRRAALERGFPVQLADARVRPCEPDPSIDLSWLRDYQSEAIDVAVRRTRGILDHPTGAGKAEIIVATAMVLPCTWLILAPEAALMHNVADRFEKNTGEKCGRVGDGKRDVQRVTAATFQSFASAIRRGDRELIDLLERVQAIYVDEVHTLPADSYYGVAMRCTNAYWRFGCSGTPLARGDKRSTYAVASLGEIIHKVRQQELVDKGFLAKPLISMIAVSQVGHAKDYASAYGELVVRSRKRNAVIVDAIERATKPSLLFVKEIDHGRALQDQLEARGMNVEFAFGQISIEQRKRMIAALERGALDVIVCSVVMQTGINIPSLRSMVVASGGKSVIAALQRVGRGTRVVQGKTEFEVVDVMDVDGMLAPGVASAGRWPARHARERQAAYVAAGYSVRVVDGIQAALRGA